MGEEYTETQGNAGLAPLGRLGHQEGEQVGHAPQLRHAHEYHSHGDGGILACNQPVHVAPGVDEAQPLAER